MKTLTLPQAIARQEGFYIANSRAARNHNPGNMNWGSFASKHGATGPEQNADGSAGRFAHFPNDEVGFSALVALLKAPGQFESLPSGVRKLVAGYAGSTVHECLNKFAPPSDNNNTSAYEANVCIWCNCTPSSIIDTLLEIS